MVSIVNILYLFCTAEPSRGRDDDELHKAWALCKRHSKSVEVFYRNMDGDKVLTKIHFPFNPDVRQQHACSYMYSTCTSCIVETCVVTSCRAVPYSGKISLVQNFAELPPSPSEENFVVLNFALVRPHPSIVHN